jgi:hypothetical protein
MPGTNIVQWMNRKLAPSQEACATLDRCAETGYAPANRAVCRAQALPPAEGFAVYDECAQYSRLGDDSTARCFRDPGHHATDGGHTDGRSTD